MAQPAVSISTTGLDSKVRNTVEQLRQAVREYGKVVYSNSLGAESMVLRGALELLRRDRPAVLLECTQGGLDDYGVNSDDVYDFLVGQAIPFAGGWAG